MFPETREARCWFHKIANVLAALPKSAHPGAKKALAEIWNAEDKAHARTAVKAFEPAYGAKFAKATAKITGDLDQLLAFYDYPSPRRPSGCPLPGNSPSTAGPDKSETQAAMGRNH